MRLEITGRHLTITPTIRRLVEGRIDHTLRPLNDSALSAHVVLTSEGGRVRAEVTLHAGRERFLHAEATSTALEVALTAATGKIDRQARKLKGKWQGRRRRPSKKVAPAAAKPKREEAQVAPTTVQGRRLIRARKYPLKRLSIHAAVTSLPDRPGAVLVFRHAATDALAVLLRRPDGRLELIEAEA